MRTTIAALVLTWSIASQASHALVLPPEGITFNQIHLQFEWDEVVGATSYDLQVVPDDLSPNPFGSSTLVIDTTVPATQPRTVATTGIEFGEKYAWRVRGFDGAPLNWSATRRFEVAALPGDLPTLSASTFDAGVYPGLTLLSVDSFGQTSLFDGAYILVVDEAGDVVLFHHNERLVTDVRLTDTGRLLFVAGGIGYETLLNGQVAWRSHVGLTKLHHEISLMPTGDFLTILQEKREVTEFSETKEWNGDRVVVLSRTDGAIDWDWSVFDHYSTLDIDQEVWDNSDEVFDWTHLNGAVFNTAESSIEVSSRHLSRITRIAHPSGSVVFNMGFNLASGEALFGDNLFSWQHAPEIQSNGNLLLFDNGNRRDHIVQTSGTGVSKAVELAYSGSPVTGASIVWEWTLPTYEGRISDADRLPNGNTLVTAGVTSAIHEVDDLGVEQWRLELGGGPVAIYRAERIDALIIDAPGDSDGDGIADFADNCPDHANVDQADCNLDGFGDVCSQALAGIGCNPGPTFNAMPALPAWAALTFAGSLACSAAVLITRRRAHH